MTSNAFRIRVLICFLLSLIPATDVENLIYSERLARRGHWGKSANIVVVDVDSATFNTPYALRTIESRIEEQSPRMLLVDNGAFDKPRDLIVDSDGVVRRALVHPPSVTYQAWANLNPSGAGTAALPRRLLAPHLINFLGGAGTIPHCPAGAIGEPGTAPSICNGLKGKIVLLGEESDLANLVRTPLGEMSRTEALAHDINTVANHKPIYETGFAVRAFLILTMICLAALYITYYPVMLSAIATVSTGILVVVFLFQAIFEVFDLYIPSLNIGGSLLITYLIFTGYRLARQENLQWRTLKQQQYLRELDQMKTNFVSLVSHDLKTPLARVQAVVDRMRRELSRAPTPKSRSRSRSRSRPRPRPRDEWHELVDSLDSANQELKHYISSILNLSKLESQKTILKKRSNDVNRLIQQALKRLKPLAQQKGISVEEALEPLFSVECDEDLLRQVITNLIDNAIKYSPLNSKVIVRSREEEGFVRVDVEDFGPGIPKDQLPLMFRKFSRYLRPQGIGTGVKEQVKGTGLGLYLSKYFIELHGGKIRLKTIEGQGTTFTFTLPLNSVETGAT